MELRKRECEMIKELNDVNLSTQKLNTQFNSLNAIYSNFEQKDIQISSNIHAIKIQIEKIKADNDNIKSKIPTDFDIPLPKENLKFEKELSDRREKREKTLQLINEMHNEGIRQIELIEKNSNEEKKNLFDKIQYLSQKKIETKELIGNVEHEFNDVRKKLEDEIQDFRGKSFTPDQEKILFLRNELEIIDSQIESTERETTAKRNKLDEMSTISTKLQNFLDEKKNLFQKEISNNMPIIEKQNHKIHKLRLIVRKQLQKNKESDAEIQNLQPQTKKVDYLKIYKKNTYELDEKYSQLHEEEKKKLEQIDKKLIEVNEHIQTLQTICDDHQHSLDLFNNSKLKLHEQTEKMRKKDIKLTQLVKQANCELDELKMMQKADELSTNNTKIVPIHVKSYVKLPNSVLNLEQAIAHQHKNLMEKINTMKLEYTKLDQKEQKIKSLISKLQQENSNLKKVLAPYPKIRKFFKKYCIPKNAQQNSSKLMIKTQQATISVPTLTLECQKIDIH